MPGQQHSYRDAPAKTNNPRVNADHLEVKESLSITQLGGRDFLFSMLKWFIRKIICTPCAAVKFTKLSIILLTDQSSRSFQMSSNTSCKLRSSRTDFDWRKCKTETI